MCAFSRGLAGFLFRVKAFRVSNCAHLDRPAAPMPTHACSFDIHTRVLSAWRCLVSPELKDTSKSRDARYSVLHCRASVGFVFQASDCYRSREISISTQEGPRGSDSDRALAALGLSKDAAMRV